MPIKCTTKQRTKGTALFIKLPDNGNTQPNVFKECCYTPNVFADATGIEEQNDFTGIFHKRQINSESCQFILVRNSDNSEYVLDNNTYGVISNFGTFQSQPNLKTFKLEWSKVLSLGEGSYTIRKDINIAGITYVEDKRTFNLKEFSYEKADKTIRIEINMNGYLENIDVDFYGVNYQTTLRIGGFFGRKEPKFEKDNIVYKNKKVKQISLKKTNEYLLQTELLPSCITNLIFNFFIFADEFFVSDYNIINHDYDFKNKAVTLEKNNGTKYYVENRKARINLSFTDRYANENKFNF